MIEYTESAELWAFWNGLFFYNIFNPMALYKNEMVKIMKLEAFLLF